MNKNVSVAMYIRLSNEDADISKNDAKIESNSVSNQRDLLMDFISRHPDLADSNILEFCDDGYSGTNFERPAVQQLLTKVRQGEINCIVVKDFSRFGRNYLELGDYLEQVFPFLGVRFISVNDGYDSAKDNGITAGLDIGLKNLIYDLYSKDLSKKVKTAKTAKMKKGEYIGSFAPFGYLKAKDKKNAIVVDEEAAVVVKRIFQLAAEGNNTSAIAKILNADGVPSPARHYQKNHNNKKWRKAKGDLVWQTMAVLKIFKDETYTGKTINHKREKPDVNSMSTVAVPREQWIVVPNTHEAIISEELYLEAQKAIRQISKRKEYKIDNTRVLYGKVKCGICKKNLQRSHTKVPYYICKSNYYDENSLCFHGRTKEPMILEVLLEAIRQQAQIANKAEKLVLKAKEKSESEVAELLQSLRKAQQYLERLNALRIEEYEKYSDGKIGKDDYLKQRGMYNQEIEQTSSQISKLEADYEIQKLKNKESENQFVEHFKSKQEIKELSRDLVNELVDSIYVFGENQIEIVWNFADDYEKIMEML
ncbi:recombinase family protein [Dehalobacter sp.]|jgi:DNA invertase Pin-like site-specific DNA recombinase|nr:recombinase family protein [Dehalobacter sp.]MCG1025396.1 recombinase family protein [Dehalobacter sp.]